MSQRNRWRRLLGEGSWVVAGQAASVLGSLVMIRVLTELLSPSAYGELTLGLTVAALANQIIFGPLAGGVTRFYAPAAEKAALRTFLHSSQALLLQATGMVLLLAMVTWAVAWAIGQVHLMPLLSLAMMLSILAGINAVLGGLQSAARQRFVVALSQGFEPWLRIAAISVLAGVLGSSSETALLGYVLSMMFIVLYQGHLLHRLRESTIRPPVEAQNTWRRDILSVTLPTSLYGFFTWLQLSSDRWALQWFSSTADVGLYAVVYQLGYYPITLLGGMLVQFLMPIAFQRVGDASDPQRRRAMERLAWRAGVLVMLLTALGFGASHWLHAEILGLFAQRDYGSVSYLLPWMVMSGGLLATGQTLALILQSNLRTAELSRAKIGSSIIGIVANLLAAHWFGLAGIVGAGVLSAGLYAGWMMLLTRASSVHHSQ
ncbi:lipopolysaccharide biosynthesis protein [Curvibacter sp. HBC28]|uniref:Lipopolysaccharide biosynthesis protein n=1 Tax=Curvibacter microcysteis TaxID=3026419 RepID=A0ABT5MFN4_9BURK|nr:lipopolysaccharide biosynthesis protein [Curvibacter sp. HBC28]MDD0815388.1 lipopolysaccharide biosynthesis protein [Curvibacter sp. HBC28]